VLLFPSRLSRVLARAHHGLLHEVELIARALHDALFDRPVCDESKHADGTRLADAVHAVHGLKVNLRNKKEESTSHVNNPG